MHTACEGGIGDEIIKALPLTKFVWGEQIWLSDYGRGLTTAMSVPKGMN
jgi:hypothetical protein